MSRKRSRTKRNIPIPHTPTIYTEVGHVRETLNSSQWKQGVAQWDTWLKAQGLTYAQRQYLHMQVEFDMLAKERAALAQKNRNP